MTTMSPNTDLGEQHYRVRGMTCDHCAGSVTHEVSEVNGVTSIDVRLSDGHMVVRGEAVDERAVHVAVAEAGYDTERL